MPPLLPCWPSRWPSPGLPPSPSLLGPPRSWSELFWLVQATALLRPSAAPRATRSTGHVLTTVLLSPRQAHWPPGHSLSMPRQQPPPGPGTRWATSTDHSSPRSSPFLLNVTLIQPPSLHMVGKQRPVPAGGPTAVRKDGHLWVHCPRPPGKGRLHGAGAGLCSRHSVEQTEACARPALWQTPRRAETQAAEGYLFAPPPSPWPFL